MVNIMRETWGDYLVDARVTIDETTPLPSLDSLRKKILIKVKHAAPKPPKASSRDGSDSSSDDEQLVEAVKKGNIIEALGSMGAYTRACHFKSFDQPEAKLPTHVFALSEKKLIDIHADDPTALLNHNKVRGGRWAYHDNGSDKSRNTSCEHTRRAPEYRQAIWIRHHCGDRACRWWH